MTVLKPTLPRALFYRLWRQRRVLLAVPVLILIAAVTARTLGGLHSAYLMPDAILRAVLAAAAITALAVCLLPAAPLEILAGGIVAACFVATEPWHGMVFQPAHKGGAFTPLWARVMMFSLAAYLGWTLLLWAWMLIAQRLPENRRPLRYGVTVRNADAGELRRLLSIHPGATCGRITFGPRDWDGFVSAELHRRAHDPDTFRMVDTVFKYRTRLLSRDGETDIHEVRIDGEAPRHVHARYRQVGRHTRIAVEERPGPPDRLAAFALRLGDVGADLLRARADAALDRPSPAILLLPQYSALCLIARMTRLPRPRSKPDAEPT